MFGKYKKRIIGIILMIVVLVGLLIPAQAYLLRRVDHNQIRLEGFHLEKKNSLDVVVMGASETYYGFIADEAYKKTGITSYPYAFQYNPVTLWKYELKEILKRQKPKVLVVEVNGAGYGAGIDDNKVYSEAAIRILSDSMRLSNDKKVMLNELRDVRKDGVMSYYWPFLKFHSQPIYNGWRRDIIELNKRGYSPLKGVFSKIRTKPHNRELAISKNIKSVNMDKNSEKALREFVHLSKKSGIKHVLFVRFPHKITNERQMLRYQRYLRVGEVIRSCGGEFMDFSNYRDQMDILPDKDFVDTEHLNLYGAKKFTYHLMQYLKTKYKLQPTKLSADDMKKWETSVRYIEEYSKYYEEYPRKHPDFITSKKRFKDEEKMIKELETRISRAKERKSE